MMKTSEKERTVFGMHPVYVVIAVIVSLLFHIALIEGTGRFGISMPGVKHTVHSPVTEIPPILFRLQPEKKEDIPLSSDKRQAAPDVTAAGTVEETIRSLDVPDMDINPGVEQLLEQARLYEVPQDSFALNGVRKDFEERPDETISEAVEEQLMATAPRPEIVEIDYSQLPESRRDLPGRILRPELERTDVAELNLPSLATPSDVITMPHGSAYSMQLKSTRPTFGGPDVTVAKMESGPVDSSQLALPDVDFGGPDRMGLDPVDLSGLPVAFDGFVTVRVSVVRDTTGPGGFFEVEIAPNVNSDSMRDISKDVLFIIDRSSSITREKFKQFKLATVEALAHLNAGDRFNIVSFTDSVSAIFPNMMDVNGRNLQAAEKAINGLIYGGNTDVFSGVAPFVRQSNGNMDRPYNIFLLTDGKSTVNIFESSQFLRQIARMNPGNVSIFSFSAGKNANRQLLDYLGYLNRGGKFHVDEVEQIRTKLVNYISSHSSLVIMDLKYTANGMNAQEMYPRTLPHLYRGETLKLFGRFADINDELVLALNGRDADLEQRDFVFRRPFNRCETGRETLPYEWAAQKILWLSALRHCSDSESEIKRLEAEITSLRTRFRVYTLDGE